MKIGFMRWVDFWVGVPLCFLLSIYCCLKRWLGLGRLGENFRPRRILFIELSEMGSTILASSAMKKARELFRAELFFLIFAENAESVRLLDLIPESNLITIRSKSLGAFVADTFRAVFRMRALNIDTAVDLELFSRFTGILSFLSSARARVGYFRYHTEGLYRGTFQTHKVDYNPYYHMGQNFLSLIYSIDAGPRDMPLLKRAVAPEEVTCPKVSTSHEEEERILQKLQAINPDLNRADRKVLLNPGASQFLPIRKWPIERYQQLVHRILDETDAWVIIVGVPSDKVEAEAITHSVRNDRCIDFTGRTDDLRELVTLFNLSQVLVTNDSGPAHFAALTDIHILVFFGPETPALYRPVSDNCHPFYAGIACSPCVSAYNHRKTSCQNNLCLQAIDVDAVFSKTVSVL